MHIIPDTRDLVFVGGGHAHALVLRKWGMKPLPGTRVTLINPGATAPYTGMLPGHVAGHYTREALDIDLVKLARFAGARLVVGAVDRIDPQAKSVHVAGRGEIAYDVASVDVGIHGRMPQIDGFDLHGIAAKPLDVFASRWRAFRAAVQAGKCEPVVAVIGGGTGGVELSMAMAHALAQDSKIVPKVTVIEARDQISGHGDKIRQRLHEAMARLGVTFLKNARVASIHGDHLQLETGGRIDSQFTVGAAGAFAHDWLRNCPLPLTEDGFIKVDEKLRVLGSQDLFAVGDCAHMDHAPRPKAGVYAVRAAPVLHGNIEGVLSGGPLKPFHPQKHFLKLISLGDKAALAERGAFSLAAPFLWAWKDQIDRKFMDQFRQLPKMDTPVLPYPVTRGVSEVLGAKGQVLCGGCGAKVGAGLLQDALAHLPAPRGDVLRGAGDDAALLQVGGAQQVLTTDQLRAFIEDPLLFARITALHALGDIWAMGAEAQAALLTVTLPRMSPELQARTMSEIVTGARSAIEDAGAQIVGGHTSQGAELSLGISLTGLLDRPAIGHGGARAGDALILTRPIGSGTLLAAEMQGRANGRDVVGLLEILGQDQRDAAEILRPAATAMTDVTGFGLAGHALTMCRASSVMAVLELEQIPVFAGAVELAAQGLTSTIWADNRAFAPVAGQDGPRLTLLHDPQTAGGFLASVPAGQAEQLIQALVEAGHQAAVIGSFRSGPVGVYAI